MAATYTQFPYIPNTQDEQAEMLASLGLDSIDQLFLDIPREYRNPPLNLPEPMSELELQRDLQALASQNRALSSGPSFLGAGSYQHFIPSVVKALMTRGEFLTAYTPYQAEASQGTLQVIYEFQTLISNLYGMEVSNAGMYDGATSLAEAVLMACRVTRRSQVAVAATLSPIYRQVIETYCQSQGIHFRPVPPDAPEIDQQTACLVTQYPNFYGYIEDLDQQTQAAHQQEALMVVSADPTAMGMFQPPGYYGVGHCHRGRPTPGYTPKLRGALRRPVCHQTAIHPPDAQSLVRADGGPPGHDRLCVDPADSGTAHSAGTGHQQHLHQRGPLCLGRDYLPGRDGQVRLKTGRRAVLPKGSLLGIQR